MASPLSALHMKASGSPFGVKIDEKIRRISSDLSFL
jgi:hypothetical protein